MRISTPSVLRATLAITLALLGVSATSALDLEANALFTRVVDGGQGLCSVTAFPNGQVFVYDTGHWNHDWDCFNGIKEVIEAVGDLHGQPVPSIELMVLSHSDSDHLAATDELLSQWDIETVIWSPYFGDYETRTEPGALVDARDSIGRAVNEGRIRQEINLDEDWLEFGRAFDFGVGSATPLFGRNKPPWYWALFDKSKKRNAGSTVFRVDYAGKSILFTGDAVGRKDGADLTSCIATEEYLVKNADERPIQSAVLIAAHHGADNASADCFIKEVDPDFVIFSAGQGHDHPRWQAAGRFTDNNIPLERIFRTDLGDDEGGEEWYEGKIDGNNDPNRDDDVEILIRADGEVCVGYRGRPTSEVCRN